MRKNWVIFSAGILLLALSAFAQEQVTAPAPVEDELWASLVGEWEGWSEDVMGRSEDEIEVEWELRKQFIRTKVTAKDKSMVYKMVGYATKDPATGAITSYWFDSMRGVYRGTETRTGNKFTLRLEGPATIERTYELVDNKLIGTYKVTQPDGKVIEGKSELMRKVKKAKKS